MPSTSAASPPSDMRLGLVIPTRNAGELWRDCLEGVARQSLRPQRLLVVDSSSTDDTAARAAAAGFEVRTIAPAEFNHGGTRQWAVEFLTDCDIVIFLTQDAIPADPAAFNALSASFADPAVAVAYGRQLPHAGATVIAAHSRTFNYGTEVLRKNLASASRYGTKTFFTSNSFAAYRRSVLLALGGFRRDLILGEDMEFAARAVKAGYSVVYAADARVFHSHDYTLLQTLERYFDIGVFDHRNPWMREEFGSQKGEGWRFLKSELKYLARAAPAQIPVALCQTAAKLAGYRLGRWEAALPAWLKQRLSMMPAYFRDPQGRAG